MAAAAARIEQAVAQQRIAGAALLPGLTGSGNTSRSQSRGRADGGLARHGPRDRKLAAAWNAIKPLQHSGWLGGQLAAALLRARRNTRAHVPGLNVGLRVMPQEPRRARDGGTLALLVEINAIRAAAEAGLKDHDRWIRARAPLARKCAAKRSTSKLPELATLALATQLPTAGKVAKTLGVSSRAAQILVAGLGLRETTGKVRYRAQSLCHVPRLAIRGAAR